MRDEGRDEMRLRPGLRVILVDDEEDE